MYELIYTSIPKGLLPGRSGFATAAMSEGMPPNLIVPLENLSGYNFTLRDNTFLPVLNPPCCYYIKMRYGNQLLHIAGRVAPNGLDYSQRNNKIAHHFLFESSAEMAPLSGGAAGLFLKEGIFCSEYTDEPTMLPFRKVPVCSQIGSLPAKNWAEQAGHAGFAAFAAEKFRKTPEKPLYLIYPPGTPVKTLLELVMEVCALLDEKSRNDLTFSTYFGNSPASVDCFLRMLPDFSPLVSNLRRFHPSDVIELGQENELPLADEYPDIYEQACTGKKPKKSIPLQTVTVSANPITVIHDDPPPPEPVIELSDAPPTITIPPPVPPKSNRKLFFLGAVGIIILAITGFILCKIIAVPSTPPQSGVIHITAPAVKTPPPEPVPIQPLPAKQSTALASAPATRAVKTIPEKVHAAPKKTIAQPSRTEILPMQSEVELFIKFREISSSNTGIDLPPQLHGVQEIYPVMDKIGTSLIADTRNNDFVEKGVTPDEVFVRAAIGGSLPPQPVKGRITDVPHLLLKISRDQKSLQVITYTGNRSDCIMPELSKIKQIYFRLKNKVYLWHNRLTPNHAAMLEKGTITISLNDNRPPAYTPGRLEGKLKSHGYIQTRFGNSREANFNSIPFYLKNWNDAVERYTAARREYYKYSKKIKENAKTNTPPRNKQAVQAHMQEMQKRSEEGDFKTISDQITPFLNKFFNPAEKNLVAPDKLQEFAKNIAETLAKRQYSQNKKAEIKKMEKNWLDTIKQLKIFQQLQKKYSTAGINLATAEKQVQSVADSVRLSVHNIHQDIVNLLHGMMTVKSKNGNLIYDKITDEEISKLCNAIKEKIVFEVVRSNGE